MAKKKAPQLQVKQTRSVIGSNKRQKATMEALGLRRIGHTVQHSDTPQIRGMLNKVQHLIQVTEA